jgi:bacillithiol system protein YtxJ
MSIHWIPLETPEQLQQILSESDTHPVIIYKHSTRCSISSATLGRIERSGSSIMDYKTYFLDVIRCRPVSNLVAETFSIEHESPQLLLISRRQAILNLSHFEIDLAAIGKAAIRS